MSFVISPHNAGSGAYLDVVRGTFPTTNELYSNRTVVGKYLPGALLNVGSFCKVTLYGTVAPSLKGTISAVWIGQASNAAGAKAYDFDGGQVQVTFNGGSAGVSLTPGSQHLSDEISFTINRSRAILIAYNIAATSNIGLRGGMGANYVTYYKGSDGTPLAQAATTSKQAGYTAAGGVSPILRFLQARP